MPFEIKLDADAALKQLDELTANIAALTQTGLTTTFTAWQAEDMHRKFPKVDGSPPSISTNTIYPRSQLPRVQQPRARSTRTRSIIAAGRAIRSGTAKPILRPELFEKLCKRMVDMLKEACAWH